jgi:hypothetical protein
MGVYWDEGSGPTVEPRVVHADDSLRSSTSNGGMGTPLQSGTLTKVNRCLAAVCRDVDAAAFAREEWSVSATWALLPLPRSSTAATPWSGACRRYGY